MTENDDLVKRLRRMGERVPISCPDNKAGCLVYHYRIETDPTCAEAADRIEELESWKAAEDAHHHMLRAENERLRGKVSQAILYFDDVAGLTENPLYNPLEVGFRHSPLSPKERGERYATACSAAWQSAQHGLAALGETQ